MIALPWFLCCKFLAPLIRWHGWIWEPCCPYSFEEGSEVDNHTRLTQTTTGSLFWMTCFLWGSAGRSCQTRKQRGFLFILFYFRTHSFSNVDCLTAVYIMTIKKGGTWEWVFYYVCTKKHNLWYRITGTCVLLAAHYEHAWFPSASNNSTIIFSN